ncbi:hypothetical protein Tco_0236516 [Tanacetum coccineum]
MMIQAQEEGEGSAMPTDPQNTPTISQPSTSQPQKKQPRRKQRKDTKVPQPSGSTKPITDEAANEEHVPTHSNDPLLSGEDRLKLNELMELCTKLSERVLNLETAKTAQAKEIASLKKKVKQLQKKRRSRTPVLKRLRKVGSTRRVESSDEVSLGAQEDASKQGRKIVDLDADTEVTLVDETHRRNDDLVFDTSVLDDEEVFAGQDVVEKEVSTAEPVTTAGEVVTTASVEVSAATTTTTTVDELTLAQTLIEIKAAKPKVRGVMIQEPSEFTTTTIPAASKSPHDKGKAKMIESKKPLKKKDQIMYDQEVALNLQAQLQAELEEEERLARQKEEEANIALIESWDNTQAMMDADYELAARLQSQEQEELTIEEKLKLFIGLMDKSKKHFARLRVEDQRRKPPTKAQKRNQMCTYLRNMVGFTHNQLKNKSFDEVQKAFDNTMSWIDSFVPMDYKVVNESEVRAEGSEKIAQESSSKRAGDDLQQESSKKQKVEDDKEREELKQCFKIVPEEEIAIDVIPLATKPTPILNFQIHRKGRNGYYEIMRADGSAKTYLLFSQLLKEFDREDLENL